ncbi:MAG: hypothetical protein P8J64_02455 [Dehalococcoidia bacterium]|nr:hypothetical protein [Dehalococcoidia bacterium]
MWIPSRRFRSGDFAISRSATGILLHPSFGVDVDEAFEIQGHVIRFLTIDLSEGGEPLDVQLTRVVEESYDFS